MKKEWKHRRYIICDRRGEVIAFGDYINLSRVAFWQSPDAYKLIHNRSKRVIINRANMGV